MLPGSMSSCANIRKRIPASIAMQLFWAEYLEMTAGAFTLLFFAYVSLLITWPIFLWLEKATPAHTNTPHSNYSLNWKITWSNLLLAPCFVALMVWATVYVAGMTGLPRLSLPTSELSVGIPVLDIILQGSVIFFTACFLLEFSYYWWHRAQHQIPVLWELHKLHHSDENLNATTIYRSHFLEPTGQALFRGLTIGLIFDTTESPQTILAIVAAGLLPAIWDYFIHANVRIDALHRLLPFFSIPQYHWIHHSKLPQHRDKNFAIFLPMFDIAFGTYYRSKMDEYPPTGLSSGEKIESLWKAHAGPFTAWAQMLKNRKIPIPDKHPN